ncbi:MAG TPA: rhomboid family intramembrane serine protease [Allosphingosinicella sp.]|nr:rhomboid family intramembrane serine protease [Allosphingosinicella sp.]
MRPPQDWQRARVTIVIAAITALAWLIVQAIGRQQSASVVAGFISAQVDVLRGTDLLVALFVTPLTATLLHSNLFHIVFNLVVLLACGRAVENILGSRAIVLLYVAGAYVAAFFHYLAWPHDVVPMIGASGAISAIVGAWVMLFGPRRANAANPALTRWLQILWLLATWIVLNLLIGYAFELGGARLAVAAHIGGFLVGLILAKPLLLLKWRGA